MRFDRIARLLGTLIIFVGLSMLLPAGIALLYEEWGSLASFGWSIGATVAVGVGLRWLGRGDLGTIYRREALVVVAIGWTSLGIFGALPYLLDGTFSSPVDAYFEATSGFTTTGATVLDNIDGSGSPSHAIHFWRCFTHWLGGMGIVVLFVAIFPQMGVGGKLLYKSEVPGPITEGLRPKIRETSSLLYRIYVTLTLACMVALMAVGMTPFEAACHALSTLGTGGFSTRGASIAGFDSVGIDAVITVFMILAGINFGLYFTAVRGGLKRALRDRELWTYLAIIGVVTAVVMINILGRHPGGLSAFRYAVFQVAAIVSTTGFVTDDFDMYPNFSRALFFMLFFMGGMAGSTAGGFKTIRVMIVAKGIVRECVRAFRPQTVRAVKIGRRTIDPDTVRTVFVYFALNLLIFVGGSIFMATMMGDLVSASTSVIACLANVGPGLGDVGAVESFSQIPDHGKLFLASLMIVGRLEVFTILVLLVPSFWRQ
jgi:trk system potassium uptake protein TrkH